LPLGFAARHQTRSLTYHNSEIIANRLRRVRRPAPGGRAGFSRPPPGPAAGIHAYCRTYSKEFL
jgi:hypothetical protein